MRTPRFLLVVVCAVCAAWFAVDIHAGDKLGSLPMTGPSLSARGEGAMPTFDGAVAWLNSSPLTTAELRGKVVLVDSGRTRASTGNAHCRIFTPGRTNTSDTAWS